LTSVHPAEVEASPVVEASVAPRSTTQGRRKTSAATARIEGRIRNHDALPFDRNLEGAARRNDLDSPVIG
jgi:hypothetical protein